MRARVNASPSPSLPRITVACTERVDGSQAGIRKGEVSFPGDDPVDSVLVGFCTRIISLHMILAAAVYLAFALYCYCICTDGHLEHCSQI